MTVWSDVLPPALDQARQQRLSLQQLVDHRVARDGCRPRSLERSKGLRLPSRNPPGQPDSQRPGQSRRSVLLCVAVLLRVAGSPVGVIRRIRPISNRSPLVCLPTLIFLRASILSLFGVGSLGGRGGHLLGHSLLRLLSGSLSSRLLDLG